jgi:hypothetical protein
MSSLVIEQLTETAGGAGVTFRDKQLRQIDESLTDPHFGEFARDAIGEAMGILDDECTTLRHGQVPAALGAIAYLLVESGRAYRATSTVPDDETWRTHIHNVTSGNIALLPNENWMTVEQGKNQVQRADRVLASVSSDAERIMAAINYAYFKPGTMAGAARTLAASPEEIANKTELEAMPHLTVANWVLAQVTQRLFEQMSQRPEGRMHIVDMCSGTGATLAAITNRLGIASLKGYGLGSERLGITGYEASPAFFDQLANSFYPSVQPQLRGLGINSAVLAPQVELSDELHSGTIQLAEGDVVGGVKSLDFSKMGKNDLLVGTANYGFHRLASRDKRLIASRLAKAKNSVIIVGDLRQNGSAVNRGYFNLGMNGPLNAGNLWLESALEAEQYRTVTLGKNTFAPGFVDKPLMNRLGKLLNDDGFVTIAFKGQLAGELLFKSS